jgi:mRNA-degrading endonuclease RelE of RelBE toxin-antitoxin system
MARLTTRAQKDLADLPEVLQDKARTLMRRLDSEPGLGKKLLGKLEGKRSLYLGRTHRIIYTTDPITVLAIPPRKDAYR